ncbi:protein trichome birefringence-like 4 [Impatiens glandulifera]|uniref:protein trichome birefringence-like 4 n=1 Tax=Impatiens glandulifera TaxID=253017 RepID=UPI001FB17EF5|nr:protein trichome birefringence-like 4 [Impatiens glandulifera]
MAYLKILWYTVSRYSRNHSSPLPKSRNQAFTGSFIVIGSFCLSYFFLSASISNSPPTLIAASFASRLLSISSSSITSTYKHFPANYASISSSSQSREIKTHLNSCNIFHGKWVLDKRSRPHYKPGSCPYVDSAFNCFKNGRTDSNYFQLRWKPHGCNIPRFNGTKMLELLRGKRVVFVGDSLNRNMWQSLVCSLRNSLVDKSRVLDVSGRRRFKTQGFYSFRFKDYKCSIDFIKSPFLVQEWKNADKKGTRRETLRLDLIQESSTTQYHNADILIFNTGHWWTHHKTNKGNNYFQEGNRVYIRLEVEEAYTRALKTWAKWVDSKVNSTKTRVFFRGYSASHFRGGQWNSGGSCDGETEPIWNDSFLGPYPWMMNVLESVMSGMKTPVSYLNITRMTDYRKDGHPSIFRQSEVRSGRRPIIQDCSHWCLPGVPDSWNELLYVSLLMSHHL